MTLTGPKRTKWFNEACELLYGTRWKQDAAIAIGVSVRTVKYYADGTLSVPDTHIDKLAKLLKSKAEFSNKISQKILD